MAAAAKDKEKAGKGSNSKLNPLVRNLTKDAKKEEALAAAMNQIERQFGKGANEKTQAYSIDLTEFGYDTKVENGTWAETYDVVISDVKSCTDPVVRYALMHKAEDLLMSTGCICPLYYYTDLYMQDPELQGYFSSPLGYKYFMYCHY